MFSGLFNGLKSGFKSAINFIIRGWNGLRFGIPKLDLGPLGKVGGGSVGVPQIPLLATGGQVMGVGRQWISGEAGPEVGEVVRGGVKVTPIKPIKPRASVTGGSRAPAPSSDQPGEALRWHQTTIPLQVDGKVLATVTLKHFGNRLARA